MKRKQKWIAWILCLALVLSMAPTLTVKNVQADSDFTNLNQEEITEAMGAGWNLGNQLEASIGGNPYETAWGNPTINKNLIDAVKKAGFQSIRIPVSYLNKIGNGPDYTIDSAWLARVKEVVDMCMDNGLYAIINMHGDGYYTVDQSWLLCADSDQETIKAKYKACWQQIATYFKDYDEHLIFESMNEEFDNTYGSDPDATAYANINAYNQIFVDTVRQTGGNNDKRWLLLPGWNTNVNYTADDYGFVIPTDNYLSQDVPEGEKRIMISVHYYDPWEFCGQEDGKVTQWGSSAVKNTATWGDEQYMIGQFKKLNTKFVSQGYPVVIGEYGALDKSAHDSANTKCRAEFYRKVVQYARQYGCVPIAWDNGANYDGKDGKYGFGLFDRYNYTVTQPEIVAAINEAVSGAETTPTPKPDYIGARLYLRETKSWQTIVSEDIAKITKEGGTYTLSLKATQEQLQNIGSFYLQDQVADEKVSALDGATVKIDSLTVNGKEYAMTQDTYRYLKQNGDSATANTVTAFDFCFINVWSPESNLIKDITVNSSTYQAYFNDVSYRDTNTVTMKFTVTDVIEDASAVSPSSKPSATPTASPSVAPTAGASTSPSVAPTAGASTSPSVAPTAGASTSPSVAPTAGAGTSPSVAPTAGASTSPSVAPTAGASTSPSVAPTAGAGTKPSGSPSTGSSNNKSNAGVSTGQSQNIGLAKGAKCAVGKIRYQVTKTATKQTAGTVSVIGLTKSGKKAKSLSVPAVMKAGGASYRVTAIGKNACKGAKASKIALGKNVQQIAAGAFGKCKKLGTLVVKGKLKKVNKKAFSGCKKTIKVKGASKKVRKSNCKKLKKSGYRKFR